MACSPVFFVVVTVVLLILTEAILPRYPLRTNLIYYLIGIQQMGDEAKPVLIECQIDGSQHEMPVKHARMSGTIKNMLDGMR